MNNKYFFFYILTIKDLLYIRPKTEELEKIYKAAKQAIKFNKKLSILFSKDKNIYSLKPNEKLNFKLMFIKVGDNLNDLETIEPKIILNYLESLTDLKRGFFK